MSGKRRLADSPDSAPKRLRKQTDTYFPDVETVRTTQDLGAKILSLIKNLTDKNGRLIAEAFIELPDQDLYPDYYETIAVPLSIDMIEDYLRRGRYTNMTGLESDLKRMVQNAKEYNDSQSVIYDDAERIRKALASFMPKHNPAYLNPEYKPMPTPVSEHLLRGKVRESSASGSEQPSIKLRLNTRNPRRKSEAPTETEASEIIENGAEEQEAEEDEEDEEDLSEVQLELLDELSNQDHAINFEHKPSRRDIPDYYKIIKKPTSINDVRKMVQSEKVKTWEDFARETRLIWSNAKEFNEPGSEIFVMTETLESWLEEKLQAQGVPAKIVPKLSLKTQAQPRQLKLKVGTPATPVVNGSADTYTVDKAALERQRLEMSSALDRANRETSQTVSTPAPTVSSSLRRSISAVEREDVPMTGTGANGITSLPTDSAKSMIPPSGPAHLPTPAFEGEPPRQSSVQPLKPSLYSNQAQTPPPTNGYHQPVLPPNQQQTAQASTTPAVIASTNPIDRKFRLPGKTDLDATLTSVTYMTNPSVPQDPKWRLTRYASPSKTQTSYFTYLPTSHARIRIIPEIHPDLRAGKRKHKLFVVCNGSILPASPGVEGGGVYDLTLGYGENIVIVEVISELSEADAGHSSTTTGEKDRFEFERMTFHMYLRQLMA